MPSQQPQIILALINAYRDTSSRIPKLKIVVADDLPASALDVLRAEGWNVDARPGRAPEQLATDVADAEAIVVRSATKVTGPLIQAAPKLRVIARAGTGVDNVDVPAASARGIVVMNAPGANSISVAELAVALMLALARHVPAADAAMKQGKWEKKKFLGEEVREKTLGLAGLGRIGQEVARRAGAFDMRIIAHDPFISEDVAADLGVELVSLDELFARSDFLSLHMPSTATTKNIVNAERLAKAKKGIRIINTARGDLIDEAALADAIESGHIGGAALDVFQKEPTVDHRLQALPQVVATPHIAASTREGQELVGMETMAALRDFLRDGVIRNAVNFPSVSAEEFNRLRPFLDLGERLGHFIAQMNEGRVKALGVRYYGDLAAGRTDMIANAVLVGLFKPMLEAGVTPDWIIDLSLARSKEQATARIGPPRAFETDSALGHASIRLLLDEITLREFLIEAKRLASEGGYGDEFFDMRFAEKLRQLDAGTPESTIFAELAPLLAPLVDEAERQWKELFPER